MVMLGGQVKRRIRPADKVVWQFTQIDLAGVTSLCLILPTPSTRKIVYMPRVKLWGMEVCL